LPRQTADTFLAASTFLELLNIWGEPSPEIHAKIKYAKWNAVRIAKAFKEGKDPNESNPKPEPALEEDLQPLDPSDPEVQQLTGESSKPRQASVVEVPDEQDRIESQLAAQSILNHSLHPSAQPSARASPGPTEKFDPYPRSGFPYNVATDPEVSPLDEPTDAARPSGRNPRQDSVGGGYFPAVPTSTSDSQSTLPTAPANIPDDISPPGPPYPSHLQSGPSAAREFDSIPPTQPDVGHFGQPQDFYKGPPAQQPVRQQAPIPAPAPASTPGHGRQQRYDDETRYNNDDIAVAKAQKHARFAISALTFDDVDTAVKELKLALETLGA
jgi:vacuolar protein sorting-associated protein VTA1